MTSELALYQKKTRLVMGGSIIAVMFVGLIYMLLLGPNPDSVFRPFRSPVIVYGLGAVGTLLCLWLMWYALGSLRNPKPRVILSGDGAVVDGFSGRLSASWSDFSGYTVRNNSILVLQLKDPDSYISRLAAGRAKQSAKALSERFGSPFLIETAMLQTDPDTVKRYISAHLAELNG